MRLIPVWWSLEYVFLAWLRLKACRVHMSVHGKYTHHEFWLNMAQAFNALVAGAHALLVPYGNEWPAGSPAAKYTGKPIASGDFRGVVWNLAHGQEYGGNELGWPHFSSVFIPVGGAQPIVSVSML